MSALIDLDVPSPAREPAGSRPAGHWWKPLVAAVLLLVLGGAAPAAASGLTPVADTAGLATWASVLTEEALYTAHLTAEPKSAGQESEIRAWPLRPGGPDWTARMSGSEPRLSVVGTTVIAEAGLLGGLTMLDARTGRERWRADAGDVTAVLGDRVAVWKAGRLRVADVATGHTVWSRDGDVSLLRAGGGRLVAIDVNYRATVYAADTGRVLARDRDLGIDAQSWGLDSPDAFTAVTVVDDRLYVYGAYEIVAFAVDGVTPVWRAEVGQPLNVFGCAAAAICVPMPDAMLVLDPATGAIRWTDRRFRSITADGVAVDRDGRSALLDPATGRVLRELGHGGVVGDLMLRTDRNRTVVTAVADDRVFGLLPPVTVSGCGSAGAYFACPTPGRIYVVWRVRAAPRP